MRDTGPNKMAMHGFAMDLREQLRLAGSFYETTANKVYDCLVADGSA